jgi:ribonuclease HI
MMRYQIYVIVLFSQRETVQTAPSRQPSKPCHHFRTIFTDGACIKNGRPEAKAGAGVAVGSTDANQLSIPITDSEDTSPERSNQRAELYAAKSGLQYLAKLEELNPKERSRELKRQPEAWIIAIDSEYVVKGLTEWMRTWRVCSYYSSKGFRNLSNE